jgi:hypothetical protein
MRFDDEDGVYGYVCTRAELADFPSPNRVKSIRYRCVRCGRIDTSRRRAMWHRTWRRLTDLPVSHNATQGGNP